MSSQVVLCLLGEKGVKADRLEREKESKEQSISQLRSADVSLDVEEFEAVLALWFGVIVSYRITSLSLSWQRELSWVLHKGCLSNLDTLTEMSADWWWENLTRALLMEWHSLSFERSLAHSKLSFSCFSLSLSSISLLRLSTSSLREGRESVEVKIRRLFVILEAWEPPY